MKNKSFDPYAPETWEWSDEGSLDHCRVVSREDYDKLLEMYRSLRKQHNEDMRDVEREARDAVAEARWEARQGEDYGSY